MTVEILGSNATAPTAAGPASGYLLRTGGGAVLVDAGPGVMAEYVSRHRLSDLRAIVVTHLHADHSLDLMALAYRWTFPEQLPRIPLYVPGADADRLKAFDAVFGIDTLPGMESPMHAAWEVRGMSLDGRVEPGLDDLCLELRSYRAHHPVPAASLRFRSLATETVSAVPQESDGWGGGIGHDRRGVHNGESRPGAQESGALESGAWESGAPTGDLSGGQRNDDCAGGHRGRRRDGGAGGQAAAAGATPGDRTANPSDRPADSADRPDDPGDRPAGPVTVAFSGDTGRCDGVLEAARDADLFVCEATYLEADRQATEGHGHLTGRMAGRLAADAGVKHLVLSHFSVDEMRADVGTHAAEEFSGRITVAARGQEHTL
nr:MBL fold metallo-hydrolase [Sediminivirga luteola]